MSPHYFYSVVDNVSSSVLGSPLLIYIDDCCGHKIAAAAAFDVIEELLAAMFKSCKFVIEACCDCKIDAVGDEIQKISHVHQDVNEVSQMSPMPTEAGTESFCVFGG